MEGILIDYNLKFIIEKKNFLIKKNKIYQLTNLKFSIESVSISRLVTIYNSKVQIIKIENLVLSIIKLKFKILCKLYFHYR